MMDKTEYESWSSFYKRMGIEKVISITWEDFLNSHMEDIGDQKLTNITCPDCGRRIYFNPRKPIFADLYGPTQYSYWCLCGWEGQAPFMWKEEKKKEEEEDGRV